MGVLELIQQKAFLGKEFLTWLWYRSETEPTLGLAGSKACEIEVMGPMVLDAHYGDARSSTLRGDSPATSPEAATALIEGKKVKRMKLKLSCDGVDWICSIDGENFNIGGLNLPRAGQLPFEEVLRLRFEFALEFESMLADLYNQFIELRLDEKAWSPELKKIQTWVDAK